MTLQEYKKINIAVRGLKQEITKYALKQGVDITSDDFELKLESATKNLLKEQGFTYQEYLSAKVDENAVDGAVEEGVVINNSEMKKFLEEAGLSVKEIKKVQEQIKQEVARTIKEAKQSIDILNKKPIIWEEVNNKPKIITDKEVKGMIDRGISEIPEVESGDSIATRAVKMALERAKTLIPTIDAIESDLPKLGTSIRDGLELLKGEERLDSSAIKNLPEVLEQNNNKIVSGYGGLNLYVGGTKIGATKTVNFTGAGVTESKVNGMQTITFAGGGGGAFTDLTDVPAAYTGQGGKGVRVKADVSGLEFYTTTDSDEKVKYDVGDPTAGYVADKIIAGTGISVAEGAGANENKLVITNSNPTPYSLPTAAAATLGGIKVGTRLSIDGNGILSADVQSGSVEGTAVLSTGEAGGTKFLREDGDGTCSWQTIAGGGDMLKSDNLSGLSNYTTARSNLGLGTAATTAATDYATSVQGGKADTALQSLSGALLATGATTGATSGTQTFTNGIVMGTNTSVLGTAKFFGSTSGDVTLQPNAIAGTGITLTLPATTGTIALTSNIVSQVEDSITDGHTTIAPSGNAVYDALAGKQATLTFGIADTNKVQINAADVADNDYAKFTATGLEGRSYSEVLSDIGAAATAQTFYIGTTQVAINRGTGALTLAGLTLTTPDIGTPSAGTLTNCSGYANDINLPKGKQINLTLPDTDATATGNVTSSFNAGYSSAVGDLVFFGTGGKWLEVDADAIATCVGLLGIALEAKTDGQAMKVALPGSFVHIDAWNMTVGAVQYAGETLGAIQEAIPTGANAVIRVVGSAVDADTLAFFPSSDNQTTVA